MKPHYNIEDFSDRKHQSIVAFHKTNFDAQNTDFHLHNFYELYLFLHGDVNYFIEQSAYNLKKGNLLIINNHEIHRATFLSDSFYERLVIHVSPSLVSSLSTPETNLNNCFTNRINGTNNILTFNNKQLEYYTYLATNLINCINEDNYGNDVLVNSYISQILVMVNKQYNQFEHSAEDFYSENPLLSKNLREILSYINNNISDDLSLEILEKTFSMNRYHLSRMFKKETGSTVYNYILLKRISLAKQLLTEGNNVTEVCMMCGFKDYSNFIRTFKKITGYSPAKYNKLNKTI